MTHLLFAVSPICVKYILFLAFAFEACYNVYQQSFGLMQNIGIDEQNAREKFRSAKFVQYELVKSGQRLDLASHATKQARENVGV
jgi:hypothetical protein